MWYMEISPHLGICVNRFIYITCTRPDCVTAMSVLPLTLTLSCVGRFKYKDEYEKFKLVLNAISMAVAVTSLFVQNR